MDQVLTTNQAARMAGVGPSTIKRWADQGLVPMVRTAGGHRRFARAAIEQLVRQMASSPDLAGPPRSEWITSLTSGRRYEVEGRLLEARARRGSWYRVADEVGAILAEIGDSWERGQLTVGEEHVASDCLARALSRVGDALPARPDGPQCVLACPNEEQHTLGLALAELCVRECSWTPQWLGQRTPPNEIVRMVEASNVAMVALSASAASNDHEALARLAADLGAACKGRGVNLVLGGAGSWPARPTYGARLTSFVAFHDLLAQERSR